MKLPRVSLRVHVSERFTRLGIFSLILAGISGAGGVIPMT
jgi:hypothetical protein